jgi:hypothetical protein
VGREISVRLHGAGWTEATRYVGPRTGALLPPGADPAVREAHEEAQTQLETQQATNRDLEDELTSLRARLKEKLGAKPDATADGSPAGESKSVAPPPVTAQATPPAPGPRFGEPIKPPSAGPVIPGSAATVPAPAASYSGPKSGRIIWTGILKPNGILRVKEATASAGRVSGSLPGVPVKLRVMPAVNSADGLVIYTNNARHQTPEVAPPGPDNNFQRMTFQYDSRRAQRAQVADVPSSGTNWTEYSIRAQSQALTALVIEWEVAR